MPPLFLNSMAPNITILPGSNTILHYLNTTNPTQTIPPELLLNSTVTPSLLPFNTTNLNTARNNQDPPNVLQFVGEGIGILVGIIGLVVGILQWSDGGLWRDMVGAGGQTRRLEGVIGVSVVVVTDVAKDNTPTPGISNAHPGRHLHQVDVSPASLARTTPTPLLTTPYTPLLRFQRSSRYSLFRRHHNTMTTTPSEPSTTQPTHPDTNTAVPVPQTPSTTHPSQQISCSTAQPARPQRPRLQEPTCRPADPSQQTDKSTLSTCKRWPSATLLRTKRTCVLLTRNNTNAPGPLNQHAFNRLQKKRREGRRSARPLRAIEVEVKVEVNFRIKIKIKIKVKVKAKVKNQTCKAEGQWGRGLVTCYVGTGVGPRRGPELCAPGQCMGVCARGRAAGAGELQKRGVGVGSSTTQHQD
ncbi:hypothetical protein C7974DRAFT_371372 [Boeremia exigua]|uniref:uncharacterized protein n=1 Tax=Boeremia exigua TaxID=749465 RepID=UPI001E8E79C9|nr:uncharacterized protein C7974DRAFT_371372 [Boeremia exigua]KAH6644234.1 hypothetical protein C7974DRAFT_371372 [Boeremia exigua]